MHPPAIQLALFFVFFALFVLIVLWTRQKAKQRAADLTSVALTLGFNYLGGDSSRVPQVSTALFHRGGSRRFRNVMDGTYAGYQASVFDYSYTVSTGKSSSTYTQTVAAFTQDHSLPLFELRPQGFLDRITDALVHRDINFESHPEFSRRFVLKGEDEASVRALFTPALLSYFEMLPPDKKWHIEGSGFTLLFYQGNSKVPPQEIQSFLEETSVIAKTFFSSSGGRSSSFRA
jgi:hypothetical protein